MDNFVRAKNKFTGVESKFSAKQWGKVQADEQLSATFVKIDDETITIPAEVQALRDAKAAEKPAEPKSEPEPTPEPKRATKAAKKTVKPNEADKK